MTAVPNAALAYRVVFERIGRNHNVPPLNVEVDGLNHLAEKILAYARPHLMSRDISLAFDGDEDDPHSGWIYEDVPPNAGSAG